MNFSSFWYIVAPSEKLASEQVIGRKVLGEWLAIFRGPGGEPVAMRDRCMHRNAPLSKGFVKAGQVQCPYHGWVYDRDGMVVAVPAEGDAFRATKRRCAKTFPVREQDGYVYVRLDPDGPGDIEPYRYANYQRPGWNTVRLVNRFSNNVTNCAENFIDIPHTSFVHDKIFRIARSQKIHASIRREDGAVKIDYRGETDNLGWFSRFLNPRGEPIVHRDNFYMPNVTEVEYVFSPGRHLFIISQSVPEEDDTTLVYTDLAYNFGVWSRLPLVNDIARRILAWQGQLVIDQDLEALEEQNRVIQKYGEDFNNTSADAIHVMVESIRDALAEGNDPRTLPVKTAEVSFWVMNTIALIVVFWLLVLWVVVDPERRKLVLGKTRGEWFMDGIGLLVQGTVIPLLQIGLVATMLNALVPAWQGTWHLAPVAAFLLAFVGVDYLFYWNHRMLHTELLWKTHMVHHSVTHMDVMATSRNTVWTSLLIVYLWAHGTFLFLLAEPGAYAVGVAMTAALDMWRHSATGPRPGGRTHRVLGLVFILPGDHAWHHARGGRGNYGANLSVWDRLHGTYVRVKTMPLELGDPVDMPLWRKLLWPLP